MSLRRSKRKTSSSSSSSSSDQSASSSKKAKTSSSSSASSEASLSLLLPSISTPSSPKAPLGHLLDVDGKVLATFYELSSNVTIADTLSGIQLEVEAQLQLSPLTCTCTTQPHTLRLIQHRPGDDSKEVGSKQVDTLRLELQKRKDDLLAVADPRKGHRDL